MASEEDWICAEKDLAPNSSQEQSHARMNSI